MEQKQYKKVWYGIDWAEEEAYEKNPLLRYTSRELRQEIKRRQLEKGKNKRGIR